MTTNDQRLHEMRKLKAERDKGQWSDAEYGRLVAAIRIGTDAYQQARRDVLADRIRNEPDAAPTPGNLIPCPDCGRQVSRQASACPQCGSPVGGLKRYERGAIGENVVTVQQTGKRLKGLWLVFVAMMIVSFSWMMFAREQGSLAIPSLLFMVGFIGLIVTRIRIWWHHR